MMNENGMQMTETTALVALEEWEVENFVADAEAKGIVDAFVYSFKQGGREVTGLTARAIEEICLLNKPRISISESNVIDEGDSVLATATAMAKYVVPATKQTLPDGTIIETEGYEEVITADGVRREEAFFSNGKRDAHVEQKALTKAMRAARRQLISQAALIQAKEYLLKKQGGKPVNLPQGVIPKTSNGNRQQRTANQNPNTQNSEQAAIASYNDRAAQLDALGIPKEMFWNGVKGHFKVKARTEMTPKQWIELREALNVKDFAEWVRDLAPKQTETKTAAA